MTLHVAGTESVDTARGDALRITPLVDEGLGNSSYVVDLGDGRALVVDPARDVTRHLAVAEAADLALTYTAETHLHADFLTGSRELAARGANVLAPLDARLHWPHKGFGHGDEVDLGGLTMRALHTPGHTPEHVSWLLLDGDEPLAFFSGGSLLVGAVARTDLITPDQSESLARALWRSLQETILALPDDLAVYPTHGAGSFCATTDGGERTTTIGREKASNPLLAARDEADFARKLLATYGSFPPYFLRLRERNQGGPDVLGTPFPPLAELAVQDVQRLVEEASAVVVDARPVTEWAAGHVPGSLSIALRPQFATWLGWLVPDDCPLVFVLGEDQDEADLVSQARTIGYERLAGRLRGGAAAWPGLRTSEAVPRGRHWDRNGTIVDVRQLDEAEKSPVLGAVHVELGRLDAEALSLPKGPLTVMCLHGERAASGASILERAGRRDVAFVVAAPA